MAQIKNDVLSNLRKELLQEVKTQKITVEQFCWERNLNKATISNFVNGKKDFRVSTLVQIANALKKKLDISLK